MPGPPLFDFGPDPDDETEAAVGLPPGPPMLAVSELTALIKEVVETGFADVGVFGEISNLSRPRSGHVYFDIKDEGARIRAILWRGQAARVPFELENGLAVRAWGGLDVYPPQGAYQLIVRKVEPEGIGPLELAFRQLCDRLRAEGLFDPGRKRPLPPFPSRIVVVSSPTGAAVRDILTITARRWPAAEILIAPAKAQGQGAAGEVAAAIELANRVEGVDLVLVARGGGSLEDLWAFNEEVVARAIVASRVPVVSGVGHETDLTIADLAADARGPTPSGAAELAVPDAREILARLDADASRMGRALTTRAADARARVESLADRADLAVSRLLDRRRDRLAAIAAQLDALSPLAVLSRGYSLTQRADDSRIVRAREDARPGTLIRTRLATGSVLSRVEPDAESLPEPPTPAEPADPPRPSRLDRRPAPGAAAPGPTDRPRKPRAPSGGAGPSRTDPERS
ncbi:exodeoxyribonuclease VII large subunit [Tautonia plasticadhaerens]|uniref:Exodeoxyribonuclease 7 large subunit n=1 Tax=Tautonia plasticadhaerens TaxID=2527974 RepID=A0A518HCY7_9BACT|nr:exodeoxyribonuclease VII large subunit [Tautonia plasticadhaerens]QDV38700.1 Exodeoxyribonuclease 7 large subunit [Tautonia plasticadhaerens]